MGIITKIFGTHSEREIKRITPIVNKIESYRGFMLVVIMVMKYGVMLRSAEMLFQLLPHGKTVMYFAWLVFLFPFPSI